jgi:hypothetical protein
MLAKGGQKKIKNKIGTERGGGQRRGGGLLAGKAARRMGKHKRRQDQILGFTTGKRLFSTPSLSQFSHC